MVRPKGFIELRAVDCLPQKWQLTPLSFFSGLLYHSKALEKSINFLFEDIKKLPLLLTLSEQGLSDSYLYEKSKALLQMSISGYSDLPDPLKDDATLNDMKTFYTTYTSKRKVPADFKLNHKKQ